MQRFFKNYVAAKPWLRWTVMTIAGFLLLLVVSNLSLAWYFNSRTYPLTYVNGTKVGITHFTNAQWSFDPSKLLPAQITLKTNQSERVYTPNQLGVEVNKPMLIDQFKHHRSWLPLYTLLTPSYIDLPLSVSETTERTLTDLSNKTKMSATGAAITLTEGQFTIIPGRAGSQIDIPAAKIAILKALGQHQTMLSLPASTIKPQVESPALQTELQTLQAQLQVPLIFSYGSKKYQATPTDIASWYVVQNATYALDDSAIASSLKQIATDHFGISLSNSKQAATASRLALTNTKPTTIFFTATVARIAYTYCVATRGVDASNISALKSKLASVLNDSRGWGMGGKVTFSPVASGCNFTVWLSAANQMTSFSSACDAVWSCTVSPNVIINFDRWTNATDSWNATGGSLDDYRTMAINHETGHWLGFGHVGCGGPGQLAPIMEQQSVDLQGCVFNEWPLPSEQANLRAKLGI